MCEPLENATQYSPFVKMYPATMQFERVIGRLTSKSYQSEMTLMNDAMITLPGQSKHTNADDHCYTIKSSVIVAALLEILCQDKLIYDVIVMMRMTYAYYLQIHFAISVTQPVYNLCTHIAVRIMKI
jgi:hypothetical protein